MAEGLLTVTSDPLLDGGRQSIDSLLADRGHTSDPLLLEPDRDERRLRTAENMRYPGSPAVDLMAICGLRGTGKSVLQNVLGRKWKRYIDYHEIRGFRFWSNYWADYVDQYDPFLLEHMNEDLERYRHGYLLVDEFTRWANSKRAGTNVQLTIDDNITMLRKQVLQMVTTLQFPQELPSTIQRQLDFIIFPEMFRGRRYRDPQGRLVQQWCIRTYWYNWNGSKTGRPHRGKYKTWPPPKETADRIHVYVGVEKTFPHFRTEDVVFSPHTEAGRARLAKQRLGIEMREDFLGTREARLFDELTDYLLSNPPDEPFINPDDMDEEDMYSVWVIEETHRFRMAMFLATKQIGDDVYVTR